MLNDLTLVRVAPTIHWSEAFAAWLYDTPSQKNRRRDEKTLEAYRRDVRLMAEWYEHHYGVTFQPGQMNSVNLQEYFIQFENAPRTHRRKLASIRLLIKWSMLMGELEIDPSEWIPYVEAVEEAPRDLLPDEEQRLRLAAEALKASGSLLGLRDSLLFHLMLDAGLRISEALELKLTDLDKMDTAGKIHVFGKGQKHRNPHVNSALAKRIHAWLDRMPVSIEGTLLTNEYGLAIDRVTGWRRFNRIADAAGVEATPHTMRHQYVMNYIAAYMKGDPSRFAAALKAAQQETGDNIEVILAYYTSPRESDMRAAVEGMR